MLGSGDLPLECRGQPTFLRGSRGSLRPGGQVLSIFELQRVNVSLVGGPWAGAGCTCLLARCHQESFEGICGLFCLLKGS